MKISSIVERALGLLGASPTRRAASPDVDGVRDFAAPRVPVDPPAALTCAAVFAAINTIATDVAWLPLAAYRRLPSGGRVPAPDHPVASIFARSPDGGETTPARWKQALMGHVLGWGNGYGEIVRDRRGRAVEIHLLHPSSVRVDLDRRTRRRRYLVDGVEAPRDRILHVAGLGFDGLTGYSPIRLARRAIELGILADEAGVNLYRNDGRPAGIVRFPGSLTDDAGKRFRESWRSNFAGPARRGEIAVLSDGAEWVKTTIDPQDLEYLATRRFQVEEIARIYRLPPHKLGDYSQAHLSNVEASNLDYLSTCLAPWCEALEQAVNLRVWTDDEAPTHYVEHRLQALMRGDMRSRAEYYWRMRMMGVMSVNEIRELENMNPVDGGDVRIVPLNMAPEGSADAID